MAPTVSRVTVTGASGFLGRWVMQAAAGRGLEGRGISRMAGQGILQVANYREVPPPRDGTEALIHLAQSNLQDAAGAAAEALDVINHLAGLGYRSICYASSAVVYGDLSALPHAPTEAVTPRNDYAALKLACEKRVLAAGGIAMRLTNLIGPCQSQASVLSRILSQIPGETPLIVRTVSPVRDFCWVGDAAAAALDLVAAGAAGIFNVGRGKSMSIGELARLALDVAGETERMVEAETPDGPPSILSVDISETTRTCGWVPRMALADGIKRIIADDR